MSGVSTPLTSSEGQNHPKFEPGPGLASKAQSLVAAIRRE